MAGVDVLRLPIQGIGGLGHQPVGVVGEMLGLVHQRRDGETFVHDAAHRPRDLTAGADDGLLGRLPFEDEVAAVAHVPLSGRGRDVVRRTGAGGDAHEVVLAGPRILPSPERLGRGLVESGGDAPGRPGVILERLLVPVQRHALVEVLDRSIGLAGSSAATALPLVSIPARPKVAQVWRNSRRSFWMSGFEPFGSVTRSD